MKNTFKKTSIALAVTSLLLLSACMHEENDKDTDSTLINKTTSGVITGFGSVFVNNVEYETGSASFIIDGVEGGEELLKLGMVVSLTGSASTDGTGNAISIEFDDDIEGAVISSNIDANNLGSLNIMGVTVTIDEDTVFESKDASIVIAADIAPGNIIEVSGFASTNGDVLATRLEVKSVAKAAGSEMEVKGTITSINEIEQTFTIGTLTVDYSNALLDLKDETATLTDGLFVNVKSDQDIVSDTLVATKIELKGNIEDGKKSISHDKDDHEVELEGMITQVISPTEIEVNGHTVLLSDASLYDHGSAATAVEGMKITIKGDVDNNGDLVADKVVFKPTGDLKIAGRISATDTVANTITVFGIQLTLNNLTMVKDDRDDDALIGNEENVKYKFGVDDLAVNDWIKIKAYKNNDGGLTVTKMKRITADVTTLEKLEGVLTLNNADSSYSIAGIAVDLSSSTLAPADGTKVELKGTFENAVFVATEGETKQKNENYVAGDTDSIHPESSESDEKGKHENENESDDNETENDSDNDKNDDDNENDNNDKENDAENDD